MKNEEKRFRVFSIAATILVFVLWILMKTSEIKFFEYAFAIALAVTVATYMYQFRSNHKFLELDEMEKNIKLETYAKVHSLILPALYLSGMLLMKFTTDGIEGGILMIIFIVSYVAEKVTYFFVNRKYR